MDVYRRKREVGRVKRVMYIACIWEFRGKVNEAAIDIYCSAHT